MHRTLRAIASGAVAIAAALGLGACGDEPAAKPPASIETLPPITRPPSVPESQVSAAVAPLPPPAALTDVMARLADPNIPGAEKLDAVEMATPDDAAAMDKFGQALRDGGYAPTTFEARDLRWTEGQRGNVLALVTIKTANPQAGDFTFPMEFRYADDHWQLTRRTADALLQLGEVPSPTPTP
ncbi:MAG TPA: hypothetical protein VHH12_07540 [Mycobacterium sp.]|nr:hypothetical protein [Mycobacterium sp.]